MTFGSLFAGIGGIDLGLERAGMRCEWQVEIDDYARQVLAKHWPDVRRWRDVRTFPPEPACAWRVDLVAGGFPCTDISHAGKGAGIDGKYSGLWAEFFRVLCVLRPTLAFIENVPALTFRGLQRVLGDLASIGFDAEWSVLSACAMGAPHTRERLFVVANDRSQDGQIGLGNWEGSREQIPAFRERASSWSDRVNGSLEAARCDVREINGLPRQLVRLAGNAVVPDVAEWIGRRIMESRNALQKGVPTPPS